jgi:hypothetical protein
MLDEIVSFVLVRAWVSVCMSLARLIHERRDLSDGFRLSVEDRCVFFTATQPGLEERAWG